MNLRAETYQSVNELDVMRTLRVAVSGTILRTSLVGAVLGRSSVLVHLDKVDGAVKTAREVGYVDVHGKLLVLEVEHLVVAVIRHEIDAGADVGLCARGHELQRQGVATGADTVSAGIVSTLEGAVRCTCGWGGADGRVPRVPGIAVGVVARFVQPTPVGVKRDRASL